MTINSGPGTIRRNSILAGFVLSIAFPVLANAGEAGVLRITNTSDQEHSFTISQKGADCLGGHPYVGQVITVPAKGHQDMAYVKDGRSHCDDKNGGFSIAPQWAGSEDYAPTQYFWFSHTGAFFMADQKPGYPNSLTYRGRHPVSSNHYYEWTVTGPSKPRSTIGKSKGTWEIACQNGHACSSEVSSSVDRGTVSEESWSRQVATELSSSIMVGVETEGFKTEATFGSSMTTSNTTAGLLAKSTNKNVGDKCAVSVNFEKYDIFAVWQWVVNTPVDDTQVSVKTCITTCTPDDLMPLYTPGSQKDRESCWKPRP